MATSCDVMHSLSCDISIAVHHERHSFGLQLKLQSVARPILKEIPAMICDGLQHFVR